MACLRSLNPPLLSRRTCPLHLHFVTDSRTKVVLQTLFQTWQLPRVRVGFYAADHETAISEVNWIKVRLGGGWREPSDMLSPSSEAWVLCWREPSAMVSPCSACARVSRCRPVFLPSAQRCAGPSHSPPFAYASCRQTNHYAGAYALLKLVLGRILGEYVPKTIVVDTDLVFTTDIAALWAQFTRFRSKQCVGVADNQSGTCVHRVFEIAD